MDRKYNVLACDVGASGGRVISAGFDGEHITLQEINRFTNSPLPVRGSLLWDVLGIYGGIRNGLVEAKNRAITPDSFGIDTWGNDFAFIDRQGYMLSPPHCYRDRRTGGMLEYVGGIIPPDRLYARNGVQFALFNTLYQLVSLTLNRRHLLDNADKLLFIPDLMVYFLTGEIRNEYTLASISQLYSYGSESFDDELMEKLAIPRRLFCDIVRPCEKIGMISKDIADELDVAPVPVISVGAHDTASAVAAVPEPDGQICYISSGTWSMLGTELEKPLISEQARSFNFANEGGVGGKIRFLRNIMGLWIIQQIKARFEIEGKKYTYADMESMAGDAKPFKAFIDPDDASFYEPGNMPRKVGEFCKRTGQSIPESDGEIIRTVLESLAFKYRYVLNQLEQLIGKTFTKINIVGGGSKDGFLCSLTADCTGREVYAGPSEATALGNAAAQLIGLGAITDLKQARAILKKSFPPKVYSPEHTAIWDSHYENFLKIVYKK